MFTSEQELVDAFQLASAVFLRKLYGKLPRHFALREFDSHYGVADIVLGTFRPNLSAKWIRKPINTNWLTPIFQLSEGAMIQLDTYIEQFGVSRNMARKQLQEYVDASFMRPVESNTFKVLRDYKPVINNVVSIEAKLKNWKRAMSQAMRYRRFSDYVFVLLDDDHVWPALENLDLFEHENVGLVSLDDGLEKIHFHYVPGKISKKSDYYYNRLNETAYSYFLKAYATV